MDRLAPEARRLAQAAAVVGRRFSLRVLLGALEERDVTASVAVLLRAGIIRELRRYPEIEYSFRHGLLQQAALSTLTPSRQRALSGRVGEFLEKQFGKSGEEDPEILAYYFYRSHSPDKALTYLERAAARAEGMNATARAIELLERATRVASKSGDGGAGRRLREHLGRLREQANGASSGAS